MSNTDTITVDQAAEILDVHPTRVRVLIRKGRIPAKRHGPAGPRGWYTLRRADVIAFSQEPPLPPGRPKNR